MVDQLEERAANLLLRIEEDAKKGKDLEKEFHVKTRDKKRALEEEFEITIPDDQAEKIKTVGEAIDYIEKEIGKK